jgi:hypothetical protein
VTAVVSALIILAVLAWLLFVVATEQDSETLYIKLRPWARRALEWVKRWFK